MNTSRGAAALAEMSPFSRPAIGTRPSAALTVSGDISKWQEPTYPLVGFDAGTFLSTNKIAIAFGAAILAGLVAYKLGYR
jgi:hypothetical protein